MMPNNPIARFREKFPTRRINRKNAEAYLLSEIALALTRAEEVVKREGINEGYGSSQYEAIERFQEKIQKKLASLKDEYTKQ